MDQIIAILKTPADNIRNLITSDYRGRKFKAEVLKKLLEEVSSNPDMLPIYLQLLEVYLNHATDSV